MTRFILLLSVVTGFAFAQPQSYILELDSEPAIAQFRNGSHRTAPREFSLAQARVRDSQRPAIRGVESAGGRVMHRLDTIANALIVEVPDAKTASRLISIPGVRRVQPVVEGKAVMDRTIGIHKIGDVWDALPGGPDSAGAGIRVGIVDTGVDIRHPGLTDDSVAAPDGFPRFNAINEELDKPALDTFGNRKVIVMRSYENLVDRTITGRSTARDSNGHGTGVAFAATGRKIPGPAGPISGVAPKAYIGVYRITAGDAGSSNSASTFAALDDAVKDGMDVINLSFGFQTVSDDFNEDVARRIYDAGVVFVAAAGNNGPGLQSMAWPGSSPWVLGIGASGNDRLVTRSRITAPGVAAISGFNGSASRARGKFSGPLRDSAAFPNNELACDPFPPDSLKDAIVLILRGTCTFSVKLDNASLAGAVAAIVYNPVQADAGLTMIQADNTTPATWINNDQGRALKAAFTANDALVVAVDFTPAVNPDLLADFSSRGPSTGRIAIKPDVVAVGQSFITAAPISCCTDQSDIAPGLTVTQGTSLSSPVVAGVAALLKQSRPGLKLEDYRSLLVNTARALPLSDEDGRTAIPHEAGAGRLDASRARLATVTANPLSISFGGGGRNRSGTKQTLKLTNIGSEADTFAISVEPLGDSQKAGISAASLDIAARATAEVEVSFAGSDLRAGHHHGVLIVKGSKSDIAIRVPYWYGVASADPASIAIVVDPAASVAALGRTTLTFRVTDSSGQALDDAKPEIEAVTAGGTIDSVDPDPRATGLFIGRVRVGRTAATVFIFRIKAGSVTQLFGVAVP